MDPVHVLTREQARRVAVRAQLLTQERPASVIETLRRLSLIQVDRTNAIAPSADLLLWSRLGSDYNQQDLTDAIDRQQVIDLRGALRPIEDLPLYRAEMADWPGTGELRDWQEYRREWVHDNDSCRRDILERLRADGPLPMSELPDTCARPWASSGWNNNKNVTMLLDFMVQRGEVVVVGREGRHRLWDLASRVYPHGPIISSDEAQNRRNERRLASLGIARSRGPECAVEPLSVGDAGEPAVIDGVRGQWRVDATLLDVPFAGRTALLSPFDRLLHDRTRMRELFEFDYVLEMFKPASQRKWGYYALPILYDDRLVGKLDATANREARILEVRAIHEDLPFTATMRKAILEEVSDLARWLGLRLG